MRHPLHELHRTKLILGCVLFAVAGASLIAIGRQVTGGWASWIPWSEFGGVLIGAGVLSIGLDRYLQREQTAIEDARLRSLLSEQAPALRDAVLDAFAANHEDLARIATPDMLDHVITNSLALRLDDTQFASEVYGDIRDQAITAAERWHDATLAVRLEPLPVRGRQQPLFAVTVRWEYTTIPAHAQRQFVCLNDRGEYTELTSERDSVSAWFINPDSGIDPSKPETFELLHFAINGEARPIRRGERKNAQTYTASIGNEHLAAGQPVVVSYTYRAVMAQAGHLLFFDIEQPTRDLLVTFDYAGCDIATITTLDMVPSVRPTRIETPDSHRAQEIIRVALDGWIFPRSGLAFVWTLQDELPDTAKASRHAARSGKTTQRAS